MFVDEVDIYVKAGDGGRGAVSFRREKFVPRGGPDGGDGGPGGSVYLVATPHRNTLVHFRFNPEFRAQRGRSGSGNNRSGKHGEVLEIPVPVGTLVQARDPEFRLRRGFGGQVDDELVAVADLTVPGQRVLVAKGGRGGLGNARFVSSTNRAPRKAQPGEPGEERHLHLQLKLLADMGLVGFPNAGKSTLIARVSAAKPKIADYPFTTLTPNLGVVTLSDDRSFVVADVPGLIEGAHEGHGLGHQFLRHIERTKVLVHLVDVSSASGRDPVEDFDTIRRELELYNPALVEKPQLVAANKVDALDDPEHVARLEAAARARNLPFHRISAVTGEGVQALLEAAWPFIAEAREAEAPADAQDRAPSMTPAVRVGVLGGTFDPVHLGHLAAARAAQDALSLTEVRFIPSHHPPHRPGSPLASSADRLAMVEAAVAGTPGWHASDLELRRQGPSYTYDTLAALHDEGLSASQIFFILGADAFAEIQTWSRYPDVLDAAHFVVIARHGTALERIPSRVPEIVPRLASPADAAGSDRTRVIFIEADTPDVSSTDLRERAGRGADISDAVPAAVAELIARRGLYQQFRIQNSEFKNRNENRNKNGSKNSKNRNSTDTRVRR